LTDAEVVTLCVARSIMGVGSDVRFVRVARKRLGHLFPDLTKRSAFHKRRDRLAETIEAMIAIPFPPLQATELRRRRPRCP
jgi:hypothetical protein